MAALFGARFWRARKPPSNDVSESFWGLHACARHDDSAERTSQHSRSSTSSTATFQIHRYVFSVIAIHRDVGVASERRKSILCPQQGSTDAANDDGRWKEGKAASLGRYW